METVFWLSLVVVIYVYFGYPLLLSIACKVARRPVRKGDYEQSVTILIAAHNERDRIGRRIENCLWLDYPKKKLQILVSLDGPTDGTEFAVWKYASRGVEMVHSKAHIGKPAALNAGMRRARGQVVVFADARQTFSHNAIRRLVANLADPEVGGVCGELILLDETSSETKSDVGLYWKYEKWIRSMESEVHSLVGATGAIYAIRRELYSDLPEDTLLDDVVTPMRIVFAGKRVVFDAGAKAFDDVSCCPAAEFARKVRTLTGNYQLLRQMPKLLVPWSNPVFCQFLSHKLGRLLVPFLLIGLFVTNVFLWGGIYSWLLIAQCCWYFFAVAGHFVAIRNVVPPAVTVEEQRRAA